MIGKTLNAQNPTTEFVDTFGGYNHNLRISDAEFYDMKNMTGKHYPMLATRDKRGTAPFSGCTICSPATPPVRFRVSAAEIWRWYATAKHWERARLSNF